MRYDSKIKTTYHFVKDKMMLVQNPNWNINGENGKGDSIGRSMVAYFCYNDQNFIQGIKNCWIKIDVDPDYKYFFNWKYYYRGQRYPSPEYYNKTFSRDHTITTFVALKLANDPFIVELAKNIKYKIRDKNNSLELDKTTRFTFDLWCWVKMFAGKWWAAPLFYLQSIFIILGTIIWNKFINLIAGFGPEKTQEEFKQIKREDLSKWKLLCCKLLTPTFALHISAWQVFILKDNIFKKLLCWLVTPLISKHNHLLRLMFNVQKKKVTKVDVLNYKSMTSWRWSTTLNETCSRDCRIITDQELLESNLLDEDVLVKFWNLRHPKDIIII
jgi:hypothetical protein